MGRSVDGVVIEVNRIRCDGRGMCAGLLPERVTIDEWGYPIVDPTPLPHTMMGDARRAVAMCPLLALRMARSVPT